MTKVIVLLVYTYYGGVQQVGYFKTNDECQAAYVTATKLSPFVGRGACVWVWK